MYNHPQKAKEFTKDISKLKWHNQALWYVREKRDKSTKEIDEFEELRESASKIKSHTLEYLGYYLNEFEKNAKANGIEVLWAKDGDEHNSLVEMILRQHSVKKVVKSKSMLTEECGLNPYLEDRGITITDTDLGERIVQLASQHPSHIVLPAIHLKKEDVSDIFHKHLNSEANNTDPTYLTQVARADLRAKFLEAEATISGVNFALAKEGGFVVCTNEGNADMGTSLAPIHIASMGIEKLIPSAKELSVFTSILARSATGQAITTYTTHFIKPMPNKKIYIIIVDNKRAEMIGSKNQEALKCIRCGACMNSCPVYRRSGGHSYQYTIPGPIGSLLASTKDNNNYASLPFACSLCASCDNVCPVKIELHNQLYTNRVEAIEHHNYKTKKQILSIIAYIMSRPKLYRAMMSIYRVVVPKLPKSILYNRYNIWGKTRENPTIAKESFEMIYKRRKREKH